MHQCLRAELGDQSCWDRARETVVGDEVRGNRSPDHGGLNARIKIDSVYLYSIVSEKSL